MGSNNSRPGYASRMPLLLDGGIQLHHALQQRRATRLLIDDGSPVNAVTDKLSRLILIGARPEIRRRYIARGVAEPIILLELRQRASNAPILVMREIRRALRQRIDRGMFPGFERASTCWDMNRHPVPGIALRQACAPI